MACHAALLSCKDKGVEPTPEILQKGLDGNLCRCTGELAACRKPTCQVCVSVPKSMQVALPRHLGHGLRGVTAMSTGPRPDISPLMLLCAGYRPITDVCKVSISQPVPREFTLAL